MRRGTLDKKKALRSTKRQKELSTKKTTSKTNQPPKKTEKKENKENNTLVLKIKIKAYDYKTADIVSQKIIDNALRLNASIKGPIPLPTEISRISVNRSTFVHKSSGDQFEMRIHKRLLYVLNPKPELANSLSQISIPRGVEIEISY